MFFWLNLNIIIKYISRTVKLLTPTVNASYLTYRFANISCIKNNISSNWACCCISIIRLKNHITYFNFYQLLNGSNLTVEWVNSPTIDLPIFILFNHIRGSYIPCQSWTYFKIKEIFVIIDEMRWDEMRQTEHRGIFFPTGLIGLDNSLADNLIKKKHKEQN